MYRQLSGYRKLLISIVLLVLASGMMFAATNAVWWKSGFSQRIQIRLINTNLYARNFETMMIDISSLTNVLRDKTGADIRIMMSNGLNPDICKVLLDDQGNAKYLACTYTLASNGTNSLYLYYNFNPLSGDDIPGGRTPEPLTNFKYASKPADYLLKVGVFGGYGGDLVFIKNVLDIDYDMITYIPSNRYSYDILIHNENYATNYINNYVRFVNTPIGTYTGDGRQGGGIIMGNTLGSVTTTERLLHVYAPFIPNNGAWFNTYGKVQLFLSNTNFFATQYEETNTLLLDSMSILRYPGYLGMGLGTNSHNALDYNRWYWYTYPLVGPGITPTITTNTGYATALYYRDYKRNNYSPLLNGREFVAGCLTNVQFMTAAGKRVMKRAFIWTGGLDAGYDVPNTPSNIIYAQEFGSYVDGIFVTDQGFVLKGTKFEGKIKYLTNMDSAQTPVVVLRNDLNAEVGITMVGKPGWTDNNKTYTFTGTYVTRPNVGRFSLVVKTNNMKTAAGLYGENEYVVKGFFFSLGGENTDKYRCIPQVIYSARAELSKTAVTLSLTTPRNVTVSVFDRNGVKMKTLMNNQKIISGATVSWDGTADSMLAVAPGMYLFKVDIEGEGAYYSHVRVLE